MFNFEEDNLFENYKEEKAKHRALTAEELKEKGIILIERKFSEAEDVAKYFNETLYRAYCKQGDTHSSFYCGITDDIIKRMSNHKSEDYLGKIIGSVFLVKCNNSTMAGEVEIAMKDLQYDTGKTETERNGAVDDTDFVYMFRKPKLRGWFNYNCIPYIQFLFHLQIRSVGKRMC